MTDRRAFEQAARWALSDESDAPRPPLAEAVSTSLDDPALAEALAECAAIGRLSNEDIRRRRANRRRVAVSGAMALLVIVGGAGVWSSRWLAPAPVQVAHLETQRGQRLVVRLADGSRLRLNGATSLDVRLEGKQRLVSMARGEAYFDVAHDAARPFEVAAGGSVTRVLGTAFDVDVARADVKLAVYRGKVSFGPSMGRDGAVVVPAGWRSNFHGSMADAPTRFDSSRDDWRAGWLDTDAMRLDDVVNALNRGSGPLVLAPPPRLAGMTVSGRFKLDQPQQLLEAIGEAYGFSVRREGDKLRLVEAHTQ
jgi:transmembrane sensor